MVGAGPGDPDLLTIGGMRALSSADVVVHDRLVDDRLLDCAPAHAEIVAVGKCKGGGWPQRDICALLIDRAVKGLHVVRLKGGDPFLFGRGGEEVIALRAAGVPVTVVPGVSSALAGPACAGVPVTHRGVSSVCTIVSGHGIDELDWAAIAAAPGTLVVLMAASTAATVAAALLAGGRAASEPVAVVHAASTPTQAVAWLDLETLATEGCPLPAPSVIVVGAVAASGLLDQLPRMAVTGSMRTAHCL